MTCWFLLENLPSCKFPSLSDIGDRFVHDTHAPLPAEGVSLASRPISDPQQSDCRVGEGEALDVGG